MSASEDELAKKRVQEAVWTWTGRIIVLLVVFGFGFFTGWILYGSGTQGAPALREEVVKNQATITELRKQRADQEGQATVCKGRLDQCFAELAKVRAAGAGGGGTP